LAREVVSGVTKETREPMWYHGLGGRLHLRGGDVSTAIASFALPGGDAP
jgi:hypothetical protein